MKKNIVFLFLIMLFVITFIPFAQAEDMFRRGTMPSGSPMQHKQKNAQTDSVGVNVKVDKATNEVRTIQIGTHGRIMTNSEIQKVFGNNNGSPLLVNEFQDSIQRNNIKWQPEASNVRIKQDVNPDSAKNMLDHMDSANQHIADNDISFRPPAIIELGNNNAGNYGTEDSWHLSTTEGDSFREVVTEKVVQTSLRQNYPALGYQGNEAFSRVITSDCLDQKLTGKDHVYDPQLQSLNGGDIYQAYQDYNSGKITYNQLQQVIAKTGNNNFAIAEAIAEYGNPDATFSALQHLNQATNPTGQDIKDAFLKADKLNNDGRDEEIIDKIFGNHGM